MVTAMAVIGAGFGDEGKGLITDYLVRTLKTNVVVRVNGGGQASHTVVTPNGKAHVFSHVGAGTFAGATTILSSGFIVNPLVLDRELQELEAIGVRPKIVAARGAIVSTIYDMALNNALEVHRGSDRHGSCGIGINETVVRSLTAHRLVFRELRYRSRQQIADFLQGVAEEYVPTRMKELGIESGPGVSYIQGVLGNKNYLRQAEELQNLSMTIELAETNNLLFWNESIVFEGAQGLRLDEHFGTFPHVTRSRTGLAGHINAAKTTYVDRLQPIYITRSYVTRHGAGPLEHDGEMISGGASQNCPTNKPNMWQGSIRFAPLDLKVLKNSIEADQADAKNILGKSRHYFELCQPVIALTCLDQLGEFVNVYDVNGSLYRILSKDLPSFIEGQLGIPVKYRVSGRTFKDVVQV